MDNLTINQRINFKSHWTKSYGIKSTFRISRIDHYGHHAEKGNYKSFDIPFWPELQNRFTRYTKEEVFEYKK